MANSSYVALATNIFTAPREAFAALKEQPRVLLPVVVLLIGFSAVSFYFLSHVDMGFFLDNQLRAGNANITDAQREQAVGAAAKIPPLVYGAIGAVSSIFFVFLIIFLVASYYTVVSFATSDGVKLKQWFAFVWWCTLPVVFGLAATLVNLSIQDARFMLQDAINPLAFGNLLAIERTAATPVMSRILLGLDLFTIWSLALSAIGYQQWTGKSFVKCVAIVLGPLALIVVIAALVALR